MQVKPVSDRGIRFPAYRGLFRAAVLGALLAALTQAVQASEVSHGQPLTLAARLAPANEPAVAADKADRPRIQVAIALDTSNSMDGLIDQTRNQLWQVVNEFSAARQNGVMPILEIALFEYGNDGIAASQGHVRKISGFTRELDAVSEGLFSLTTNGGSEYCGFAIQSLVDSLQWSQSERDIKTIFIAGNESFAQGPVNYRQAVRLAKRHGISINTIHAGGHDEGISDQWQAGALLAGGNYLSIDSNQQVVHIIAPQDEKIAELNARLNQTYVPYGAAGAVSAVRQMEQDRLSNDISTGLLAKRAASKSSGFYRNSGWDLVDAYDEDAVDAAEISEMEEASLPEPMQGLSSQQRVDYVREKARQRKQIQQEILGLSESRANYVAEQKREMAAAAPSMSDALINAIRKEARQKNFTLEN
ncbi:MAG: VWA domain-containing protein [Gammaproteobacteria bacterium]|nr:MAG: VWA domain-containing protein [Gammaproteobacteria bacterium]UCH40088.1 MAG: VWA domain-containing protein [Gammaproteobacteria bacterium]